MADHDKKPKDKATETESKGLAVTAREWVSLGSGRELDPEIQKMLGLASPSLSINIPTAFPHISSLSGGHFSGLRGISLTQFDRDLASNYSKLEAEIAELRRRSDEHLSALTKEKISRDEKEKQVGALQATLEELRAKDRLGFLLSRVNQDAQKQLLRSTEFQKQFLESRECKAVVMAVDIRRSTELMLKARTPEDFAEFITTLCSDLMRIIVDSYGVFDKFTGDGVLAFFPDFYSGDDAAFLAVSAADRCHTTFNSHYHNSRKSFTSILTDIGLGIGIDFGRVHLVQVAGGLTVVGAPVVYACRLSQAPSGLTLANQPAYEVISERCGGSCFTAERELEIKHEGRMLAYEVKLNSRPYTPSVPSWQNRSEPATGSDGNK